MNTNTTVTANWGTSNVPEHGPCPTCGRCRCCGKQEHVVQPVYVPYVYPIYPQYPVYPNFYPYQPIVQYSIGEGLTSV
jgi:hypothetical protein